MLPTFLELAKLSLLVLSACLGVTTAHAAELRIVDTVGLVRSVKLVPATASVVVSGVLAGTQCRMTSIDGIAAERTVDADSGGRCVFEDTPPGTWQVEVRPPSKWQVRIDG